MPNAKCNKCKKKFYVKSNHLKLGWGKYCSIKCRGESQRTGKYVNCEICGKETWKTPKEIKRSKSGKFFCNKSCQAKWRNKYYSGELHPFWINGKNAYRAMMIKQKEKPVCKKCGIDDIKVLVVHHKDYNRDNNAKNNLIWLCRNCHHLAHAHKEKV